MVGVTVVSSKVGRGCFTRQVCRGISFSDKMSRGKRSDERKAVYTRVVERVYKGVSVMSIGILGGKATRVHRFVGTLG